MAKFGVYQNSETLRTDCYKIWHAGDYVGDVTLRAKIQSDSPSGASRQIDEIILSRVVFVFCFLFVTKNFAGVNQKSDFDTV